MSQLAEAENDLTTAHTDQEEALRIRNTIGEKHNAAVSTLALAEISFLEGNYGEAETTARRLRELFEKERSAEDEVWSDLLLSRSILAQGRVSDAEATSRRTESLAKTSASIPLRFELAILRGELAAVRANAKNASTSVGPLQNLEKQLEKAKQCGYLGYQFRLRLIVAEIRMKTRHSVDWRIPLQHLAEDSKEKGFYLVSHMATKLMEGSQI